MAECSICGKKVRFWNSYVEGNNCYCKECWQKRENKIENGREEEEREREKESRKINKPQALWNIIINK